MIHTIRQHGYVIVRCLWGGPQTELALPIVILNPYGTAVDQGQIRLQKACRELDGYGEGKAGRFRQGR